MFFTFPEDARWNAERQAVEFGVEIGEYSGVVPAPGRCSTGSCWAGRRPCGVSRPTYLPRTRFEGTAARKLRLRQSRQALHVVLRRPV